MLSKSLAIIALGMAAWFAPADLASAAEKVSQGPRMDVTFVLDTTGSMSGLIATAKDKIWAISNEILRGEPRPRLRIGLVAYRDRGDAYVAKSFPLTGDLDAVHRNLMGLRAGGGGDTPEHVSRALSAAVTEQPWTKEKGAVRIIFLVGDAPPHTDYEDGFCYRKAARTAISRGIMINTLRIGSIGGTEAVWREIAKLADGEYKAIKVKRQAHAPVVTALDGAVRRLEMRLGKTRVGPAGMSVPGKRGRGWAPGEVTCGFSLGGADLIDDLAAGRVKIDAVPEARLTPALKKLDAAARKARLTALVAERKTLRAELVALEKKRAKLRVEAERKRAKAAKVASASDSFDRSVVESVKKAAAKAGVEYEKK